MKIFITILLISLFSLACLGVSGEYYFNGTSSMPIGFYKKDYTDINKGDLVIFELKGKWQSIALKRAYLSEGLLIKEVIATANDLVEIKNNEIYINKQLQALSVIRSEDSKGLSLVSDLQKGRVPEHKILVLGQSLGSFDSRYFGYLDLCQVTKVQRFLTY